MIDCLKHIRLNAASAFRSAEKNLVHLNAVDLEQLDTRPSHMHKIICQHPEFSIEQPGQVMPIVIIGTRYIEILGDEGVMGVTTLLMLLQGINPYKMMDFTINEMKAHYKDLTDYGKQSHRCFKGIMQRAAKMDKEVP